MNVQLFVKKYFNGNKGYLTAKHYQLDKKKNLKLSRSLALIETKSGTTMKQSNHFPTPINDENNFLEEF